MTKSAQQHIPLSDNQKERPILFSTPMVQAILDGRKLMTRRAIKPQPDDEAYFQVYLKEVLGDLGVVYDYNQGDKNPFTKCPYGKPGDLLWVRERFTKIHYNCGGKKFFKYTFPDQVINPDNKEAWKWKPSIHMPKDAARIWLEVTDVRVERLQDISEEDAVKEGIIMIDPEAFKYDDTIGSYASALSAFRSLWRSINGPDSWQLNPWVWVVCFKVLSTTGREGIVRKEAVV